MKIKVLLTFSWKNANGKVVVTTADGRSFEADYVIVTTSLGNAVVWRRLFYVVLQMSGLNLLWFIYMSNFVRQFLHTAYVVFHLTIE
jgi:hypothetical protein